MRKNTATIFEAFTNEVNEGKPGGSIWHRDGVVYSYATPILWMTDGATDDGEIAVALNTHKYSRTTTTHQNGLRALLRMCCPEWAVTEVDGPKA